MRRHRRRRPPSDLLCSALDVARVAQEQRRRRCVHRCLQVAPADGLHAAQRGLELIGQVQMPLLERQQRAHAVVAAEDRDFVAGAQVHAADVDSERGGHVEARLVGQPHVVQLAHRAAGVDYQHGAHRRTEALSAINRSVHTDAQEVFNRARHGIAARRAMERRIYGCGAIAVDSFAERITAQDIADVERVGRGKDSGIQRLRVVVVRVDIAFGSSAAHLSQS
mmetsp:Transcript_63339/g.168674  ORF Transcript_63339/g.168674 Transcript_63339/m.168674 type:complete len:223 (-) Transcript_63339:77-745(-)